MLPEESSVTNDQFEFPTINVTGENLKNFPALISWIRQKGYGRDAGLVKLRLCAADRKDAECVKQVTRLMKKAFKQKEYDDETKALKFVYSPSVQIIHKATPAHHIYQYSKGDCTTKERKVFVETSVKPQSYRNTSNCCTPHLKTGGMDDLRCHIFSELEKSSPIILQDDSEYLATSFSAPAVYGDGIVVDKKTDITISEGFSLSKGLDTLLCHLDKQYDGISCPYYYSGDNHSLFPWHCEDGGLFSINYLFTGAPKFWFGISPDYFGLIDKIASGLRVDLSHSSCRAFLVDHKVLVADPDYFREHFQVPYTQVIQEPGEFIITLPFGLHAGFNTGKNLAVAANFADIPWLELGIYAPICTCNFNQIHLNLSGVIKEYRPDLLDIYQNCASLVYPKSHPREVRYPPVAVQEHADAVSDPKEFPSEDVSVKVEKTIVRPRKYVKSTPRIGDRILHCPDCKQQFTGNKIHRLKVHIQKVHPIECEELLWKVAIDYPSWKPKMTKGLTCSICSCFIRGDKTNLQTHRASMHR